MEIEAICDVKHYMQCKEKDVLGHTTANCQARNNTGCSEH
jgi:hypothetical protein